MHSSDAPRGRHAPPPCEDRGHSGRRATHVRSWSCGVRRLAVDEARPRPVVSGTFFADEEASGRRTWEAFVALRGCLEDRDARRDCTVLLELEDGRRVRGRAVTEPEPADQPGEARYLFVGTGTLTLFDWSLLDDT